MAGRTAWMRIPLVITLFCGSTVGLSGALAWMKLSEVWDIQWWLVLLPMAIALTTLFTVFTSCIAVWVHYVVQLCCGVAESDNDPEFHLNMLFKTAKLSFLTHGCVSLWSLALGLLILKLEIWQTLPVVYPLLPVIILGALYVFTAIMFKKPEVDAEWSFFVGMVLLSQCGTLLAKMQHYAGSSGFTWAATFCPSWLAYTLILMYYLRAGALDLTQVMELNRDSRANSRSAAPADNYLLPNTANAGDDRKRKQLQGAVLYDLFRIFGISCCMLGFAASQASLAVRLDGLWQAPWDVIFAPALVSWALLLVLVAHNVSDQYTCLADLVLNIMGIMPLEIPDSKEPLLPWK